MSRRILNEFSAIGFYSAYTHLLHLEGGFAYRADCRYCLMRGRGANNEMGDTDLGISIRWYQAAQQSDKKQIPIEDYLREL